MAMIGTWPRHQHDVVPAQANRVDGLAAVFHRIGAKSHFFQVCDQKLAIDGIVLGHQRPGVWFTGGCGRAGIDLLVRQIGGLARRGPGTGRQSDLEPKNAAAAQGALNADAPVHQFDQLPGDGQPQAGAAIFAGHRRIHLGEVLKQLAQIRLGNTDAGVLYFDPDFCPAFGVGGVISR